MLPALLGFAVAPAAAGPLTAPVDVPRPALLMIGLIAGAPLALGVDVAGGGLAAPALPPGAASLPHADMQLAASATRARRPQRRAREECPVVTALRFRAAPLGVQPSAAVRMSVLTV
jgi:hypothetical protein